MPELPEVETTRRGLAPHLLDRRVDAVTVRQRRLRWPISRELDRALPGATIRSLTRRGKYLLMGTAAGTAIWHLGMSGSMRVLSPAPEPAAHDHVDLLLDSGAVLRFTDPRRFGALLWTRRDPLLHSRLRGLGLEPLEPAFDGDYLYRRSRGRRASVKNFLMDGAIVVGVGNIYASEALWQAGIHPRRPAGRIGAERYRVLVEAVRSVLHRAIAAGGTTLRDFTSSDGEPGYFALELAAYGREGEPCRCCGAEIRMEVIGQRASYFCAGCQR